MTSRAPASTAIAHSEAAGSTVRVEPTARNRSQPSSGGDGALEYLRVECLTEHHRGRLEYSAAPRARRVLLASPDPVERRGHLGPVAAGHAHDSVHGAVQLHDVVRRRARPLLQPVDVLRDHLRVHAAGCEPGQRQVRGVRLRRPGRVHEPVLPRAAAYRRVGDVVLERRQLLGLGVAGPDALRAAEVRHPRVGGNASAGERRDAPDAVRPRRPCGQISVAHPAHPGSARSASATPPGP